MARLSRLAAPPQLKLCSLEQCPRRRIGTVVGMQREHVKTAIVGGWVLSLGTIAVEGLK